MHSARVCLSGTHTSILISSYSHVTAYSLFPRQLLRKQLSGTGRCRTISAPPDRATHQCFTTQHTGAFFSFSKVDENLFWGKGRTSTHNFFGDVFNRGIDSLYWSYSVTPVDWNERTRHCGLNLWKHMTVIFRFVWRPWKIQYLNHSTWKTTRAPSWYEEGHREYLISCSVEVLKKYKTGSAAVAKNLRNDVFQKLRLVRIFTRLNRSVKLGRSIISNVVGVKC